MQAEIVACGPGKDARAQCGADWVVLWMYADVVWSQLSVHSRCILMYLASLLLFGHVKSLNSIQLLTPVLLSFL